MRKWASEGQKKVCVKVHSQEELIEVKRKADQLNVPNCVISDAGHT